MPKLQNQSEIRKKKIKWLATAGEGDERFEARSAREHVEWLGAFNLEGAGKFAQVAHESRRVAGSVEKALRRGMGEELGDAAFESTARGVEDDGGRIVDAQPAEVASDLLGEEARLYAREGGCIAGSEIDGAAARFDAREPCGAA